jgi:hypothetical protein
MSPKGRCDLMIEGELHDSRAVEYEKTGNDLFLVTKCSGTFLTAAGDGDGVVELIDAQGNFIAQSSGRASKGQRIVPYKMKAVPPLVIK